mmetsp:Transcript_9177/g.12328  ORF Transcript_9177/g.12328 Transcript_9177/m.12328 type:complete len:129 (-) Transcript_9177:360-746(-)
MLYRKPLMPHPVSAPSALPPLPTVPITDAPPALVLNHMEHPAHASLVLVLLILLLVCVLHVHLLDIRLDVVVLAALDGLFFRKQSVTSRHDVCVCVMQAFWHTGIHRDLWLGGKHVDYLHHTVHAHLT